MDFVSDTSKFVGKIAVGLMVGSFSFTLSLSSKKVLHSCGSILEQQEHSRKQTYTKSQHKKEQENFEKDLCREVKFRQVLLIQHNLQLKYPELLKLIL